MDKAEMHMRHHKARMDLHTAHEREVKSMYTRHEQEIGGGGAPAEGSDGGPKMKDEDKSPDGAGKPK